MEDKFIRRGKLFILVFGILTIFNIIILIGRNQSYALFRKHVQSKRVVEIHVASEFPKKDLVTNLKKSITSHTTDGTNLTIEDSDGTIYLSGTNDQINFNYVWYSGKLWRITAINPDNTIKMITQDEITAIYWGDDGIYENSWIYQWLNEDFLDTLYNQENIIVQNAKWNATSDINSPPVKPPTDNSATIVEGNVGLLNAYEYYQSYKNLGAVDNSTAYGSGYLNNGYAWWSITTFGGTAVRCVGDSGILFSHELSSYADGVRPSVNLKSDVKITEGEGTKENPYRIEGDKAIAKINDKLNSRVSGEYVNFDGKKYRIVGIENGTTKLTSVDYVRNADGAAIFKNFSDGPPYYYSVGTSTSYWAGYLNDATTSGWYGSVSQKYKNMLVKGTYYLGEVSDGLYGRVTRNYKNAICSASNTTERTSECSKTSSIWTGYVGLPREGEMFSAQLADKQNGSSTNIIWLITPYASLNGPYVRAANSDGRLSSTSTYLITASARPSINLNSNVLITSGEGTELNPYELYYIPTVVEKVKSTLGQTGGIIGVTTSNTKVTTDNGNIREYRYSGTGVKNYVTFNDEKWRIIGIFKDDSGQEHMKIVRDEVLPASAMPDTYVANGKTFKIRYSSSPATAYWNCDGSNYDNNWGDAGLMNWLNSTGTTDGYLKTLSSTAQGMIEETKWYLGTLYYNSGFKITPIEAYQQERDIESCEGNTGSSATASGCRVWANNAATWTGKIGLMYPSDYGFSASDTYWNTTTLSYYNVNAKDTSWLQKEANYSSYEWLLSPSSGLSYTVAYWGSGGYVSRNDANSNASVRPTLYLKSDVKITGGQGTSSEPYILQ